jgi:hypothetical protein
MTGAVTEESIMGDEIRIPRELMEELAGLRFPAKTDKRIHDLMNRNNDGRLSQSEREELESLVEMSETMSLMRAKALRVLGQTRLTANPRGDAEGILRQKAWEDLERLWQTSTFDSKGDRLTREQLHERI